MSSKNKEKKTRFKALWEFLCGDNRKPTTFEVFQALYKGSVAREKARKFRKEFNKTNNKIRYNQSEIENILGQLAMTSPGTLKERELVLELQYILKHL
jgi:hypothetical protein